MKIKENHSEESKKSNLIPSEHSIHWQEEEEDLKKYCNYDYIER